MLGVVSNDSPVIGGRTPNTESHSSLVVDHDFLTVSSSSSILHPNTLGCLLLDPPAVSDGVGVSLPGDECSLFAFCYLQSSRVKSVLSLGLDYHPVSTEYNISEDLEIVKEDLSPAFLLDILFVVRQVLITVCDGGASSWSCPVGIHFICDVEDVGEWSMVLWLGLVLLTHIWNT